MAPPRASIGNVRNPATHAAILDAAAALLAEHGYAGVSMEAVARRAGAGKPTLYRWWPGKAALLMEVYEREKGSLLRAVPELGDTRAELLALLRALYAFWRNTPSGQAFRSILAEAQADPAALRLMRDEFMPRGRGDLAAAIARGVARGELAAGLDQRLVLDMLSGFSWLHLLTHDLRGAEAALERVVDSVMLAGQPGGPLDAGAAAAAVSSAGQGPDAGSAPPR